MTPTDTIQDAATANPQDVLALGIDSTVTMLPNLPAGLLTPEQEKRRQELQKAAVGYARRGWLVVPVRHITDEELCSCDRGADCKSPGKHPVHDGWPEVASCDPDTVASWWRPNPGPNVLAHEWYPLANVGIVTGAGSGIFVLDVDIKADPALSGEITLASLARQHGELPATRIHHTGSGGMHYIWRHPGFQVRNSAGKLLGMDAGKGLDIRGENGFIVAPPSVSAKGAYEINPAHDVEPADAPEWLLDMLRREDDRQNGVMVPGDAPDAGLPYVRRYVESALRAEAGEVSDSAQGSVTTPSTRPRSPWAPSGPPGCCRRTPGRGCMTRPWPAAWARRRPGARSCPAGARAWRTRVTLTGTPLAASSRSVPGTRSATSSA
jgi:hypothetical protein